MTGASSGFGRAVTEHLLNIGNKVVATLRKPEVLSSLSARYPATQLLVVQVIVTNKADVSAAFAKASEVFGRIDVVFNNAGIGMIGELESTDEADARDIFEVNFWGAVHVSSRLGLVGIPATGVYSASKYALEGMSESLASELDPAWNIKVTLIEPGPFRTEIFGNNYRILPQHPAYANPHLTSSKLRVYTTVDVLDGDVNKAAITIETFSRVEDAPMRFPLHRDVVVTLRKKAKDLLGVANKYESWTKDLYLSSKL